MAPGDVQCIQRVTKLPLIQSALVMATDGYDRIKNSSALVGGTLTRAEQSIAFVAETAKPMVNILEKPISVADSLVCQGLDKLEEKVPAITKSPEELKKYGTGKVSELKDYGMSKVGHVWDNSYTKAILKSVDMAVGLTETAVDHILPPVADESSKMSDLDAAGDAEASGASSNGLTIVQRVGSLSEKMRQRMLKRILAQVEGIRKRSVDALQRMNYSVDLIQYAKSLESAGRSKLADGVTVVQEKAKWLWTELNKEEEKEVDGQQSEPKTLDAQMIALGRRATKQAIVRYKELSTISGRLPSTLRDAVRQGSEQATAFFQRLSKATSLKDISSTAVAQLWSTAELVQNLLVTTVWPSVSRVFPAPSPAVSRRDKTD